MADKYCPNCQRMVGLKKNYAPGLVMLAISVAVAFCLPIVGWVISPVLWIIGLLSIVFSGNKCPICGTKSLLPSAPSPKNDNDTNSNDK